jgi:hypothetical protein
VTGRPIGGLLAIAWLLGGCISSRQTLTPEASKVRYLEGEAEPACSLVSEVSVGRAWFVFDERQPAKSPDDVIVRMRRLAAKAGGNLVVILENEPPNAQCSGYNGLGRIYRCTPTELARLDTLPADTAGAAGASPEE